MLLSPTGSRRGAASGFRAADLAPPLIGGLTPPARLPRRKPGKACKPGKPPCKHCGCDKATRPRGLCRRCYDTPGIRVLYPTLRDTGRRGIGFGPCRGTPKRATRTEPGSEARIRILQARAQRCEELHRPGDRRLVMDYGRLALLPD